MDISLRRSRDLVTAFPESSVTALTSKQDTLLWVWTADSSERSKQRRKVRTFLCKLGFALQLGELHEQVENAKTEIAKPFVSDAEIEEK